MKEASSRANATRNDNLSFMVHPPSLYSRRNPERPKSQLNYTGASNVCQGEFSFWTPTPHQSIHLAGTECSSEALKDS